MGTFSLIFSLSYASDFNDNIKLLATQYGARPHEFQARMHQESKRVAAAERDTQRIRTIVIAK